LKIIIKLLLGLVIFVGAIAYYAPASIIVKFLPSNISAVGLSGTLLNGSVKSIVIDKIDLQNTKWSTNPIGLLAGKLQANVSIDSNNIAGVFETTYAGSDMHTKDIVLNGELSLLSPYFERYGLTINGQFDAKFDEIHIKNGVPHNADGILKTSNTSILGFIPLNFGDVRSEFSPQEDGFQIYLNNQNGELDINGIIIISSSGIYNANLTISRNARTPDNILQSVQFLGKKINEDSVKLFHQGKLGI